MDFLNPTPNSKHAAVALAWINVLSVQTSSFSLWASVLPKDMGKCRRWTLLLQTAASWAIKGCEWAVHVNEKPCAAWASSQHIQPQEANRENTLSLLENNVDVQIFLHGWVVQETSSTVLLTKDFVLFFICSLFRSIKRVKAIPKAQCLVLQS